MKPHEIPKSPISFIREGAQGIGFAVPVDTVKRVVPEIIENGSYPHSWLGSLGYDISPELALALGLPVTQYSDCVAIPGRAGHTVRDSRRTAAGDCGQPALSGGCGKTRKSV